MSLEPGTTLGSYSVTAKIGEGGMGEVYQARDTKLDRDVALKVLPEAFTQDPDRLARFEREAKVLASLNHPNIGSIYGLEEAEGIRALVLELVEGPTLADRIKQGPIPIDEALPIAKQIAEALEAAHEQGVIHRDLKPANIKVKADGTVKVLDFGLAKAFQPDASDPNMSMSPTISLTAAATQMGMVIGTAAYMSPEQASGKVVDKRSDVWAFGMVLYEMLTGSRAIEGADISHTLAAVLMKEIDWARLPTHTPDAVRQLLRRCLERDPRRRLRDIGEARIALEDPAATATVDESPTATPNQPDRWKRMQPLAIVIVAMLGLVSALAIWVQRPRPEPRPVSRAVISVAPSAPVLVTTNYNDVAISPDGSRIVYQGGTLSEPQLMVRAVEQLEAAPLRGAEGGTHPFVSPDGEWVGFTAGESLARVSMQGGPRVTIAEELPELLRGASWGDDDMIIIGTASAGGLLRVPAAGGELTQITDAADGRHLWPVILPGGTHVLFTVSPSAGTRDDRIALLDLRTSEHEVIIENGTAPRYAPTGHVVFAFEGTLRAVPFDLDILAVTGDPVPLVEGVLTKGNVAGAAFDLSDTGSLVFITGTSTGSLLEDALVWIESDGTEVPLPISPAGYRQPRLSPDGARLALRQEEPDGFSLWVHETATGAGLRLTTEGNVSHAVWAPDGNSLFFFWQADDGQSTESGIYRIASDGSGGPEPVVLADGPVDFLWPWSITPDGRGLVVQHGTASTTDAIVEISLADEPTRRTVIESTSLQGGAMLNPTGEWLAYHSDQTGDFEVYVRPYPGPGPVVPVSIGGGTTPVWSRDGSRLLYRTRARSVLSAAVIREGDQLRIGERRELLAASTRYSRGRSRQYDVGPDGRLLMLSFGDNSGVGSETSDGTSTMNQVVLVQNWFEELKARVPVP